MMIKKVIKWWKDDKQGEEDKNAITTTVKDKGEKDVEGSNRSPFLDNIL